MEENIITTPATVVLGGNEENTYTVVGLDQTQYDNLIQTINDGNDEIVSKLVSTGSASECVLTRDDLDYIIEIQTQQTFFQSLFLGLLVCILFFMGAKK